MKQKSIKSLIVGLSLIIAVGLIPGSLKAQKITKLFEKEQYEKAEQYCAKQKGEKQNDCYKELADAYFENADYKKASEYYEKVGNKDASAACWIKYSEASIYSEINNYRMNKDEQKYKENIAKIKIEVGDANFIVAINLIIKNLTDKVINLMKMEREGKRAYGIKSTVETIKIAKWTRTAFQ